MVPTATGDYKVPRRIETIQELPRNALGKILKHELPDRIPILKSNCTVIAIVITVRSHHARSRDRRRCTFPDRSDPQGARWPTSEVTSWGYNLGRVTSVLLGLDGVPGVTVQRYCSSSLETTRMAMHAIKAGEGHAFLSVGVEAVSRYVNGKSDGMPGTHNARFDDAPVTLADGTVVTADDGPRAGVTVDALDSCDLCFDRTGRSLPATAARSTMAPQHSWSCLTPALGNWA